MNRDNRKCTKNLKLTQLFKKTECQAHYIHIFIYDGIVHPRCNFCCGCFANECWAKTGKMTGYSSRPSADTWRMVLWQFYSRSSVYYALSRIWIFNLIIMPYFNEINEFRLKGIELTSIKLYSSFIITIHALILSHESIATSYFHRCHILYSDWVQHLNNINMVN